MKKIINFLAVALCLVGLASCEKKTEKKNALMIGISCDNQPFEYYENGKMTGFDVEFAEMIGKKLNRDVQFVDMPFDSIIASLQSKKIDMAISALSPTPERLKSVDFSKLYHSLPAVLITPGLTTVKDVASLKGQTVGVQLGSTYEGYAKNILPKHVQVEIRSLGKVTDLIQELRTGRIAGLITGVSEGDRIIELNSSFHAIRLPESEQSGSAAVAFPKGSDLTALVDDIITSLQADGTLAELKAKWKILK